jgi:hypothetical protein
LASDIVDIADAVWDEATADHTTANTFGNRSGKALTTSEFVALDD